MSNVIGLLAGVIARFLSPGPNEPTGFILTAGLGIVGAFVATFIGQVRCKNLGWRSRGTFWAGSSAASRPVRQPVEGPVAA
jgi:uncharacterized membrane protein YeaQ/YmgE (transglycosylase-associated protein family)